MIRRVLPLVLTGCMTRVPLTVLTPSAVTLPDHVDVVAVVDRSGPRRRSIFDDEVEDPAARFAASQAVEAVVTELAASPRFAAVVVVDDPDIEGAGRFEWELDRREAMDLARAADAQAIVCLDGLEIDSRVELDTLERTEEDEDGEEITELDYRATRRTELETAWRTYTDHADVLDGLVRDRERDASSYTDSRKPEALRGVPALVDVVGPLAWEMGIAYATRIAPHYVVVQRGLYGVGHDRLIEARELVRDEAWEEAAQIRGEMIAVESDPKWVARAHHDLAVFYEVHGLLGDARLEVQRAVALDGQAASRAYLRKLERRLSEVERLDEQMGDRW